MSIKTSKQSDLYTDNSSAMFQKIELLAPGGDVDSIKAAIAAGTDAVYCGLYKYNARNRAENISIEALNGIRILAHQHQCKVFITLNILILGSEVPDLIRTLNKIVNTGIDGLIVQDFGLFYLLANYYKNIEVHASTQLNTHNEGQIKFLSRLNTNRVNLSRELNINEIKALTGFCSQKNMLTEVFVHGSYCIGFSGLCYISSVHGGNSGNRGRCSQPCRDQYLTTPEGKDFPLNLKDNSAGANLIELSDAGVASLKIEGRIKGYDYVYTIVSWWRKQLQQLYEQSLPTTDMRALYSVFNRDFSNDYLTGAISKDMFIDNPRDHSITELANTNNFASEKQMAKAGEAFYKIKEKTTTIINTKIESLSISKKPLILSVSGSINTPLTISVKNDNMSFIVQSKTILTTKEEKKRAAILDQASLSIRLKAINNTGYFINNIETDNLEKGLFISFQDFNSMKKKILSCLTGMNEIIDPIDVPFLTKPEPISTTPALSILISSTDDIGLCSQTSASVFFQLPSCFEKELDNFIDLFLKNKKLIPYFPSVLIGKDYSASVSFLQQVNPKLIVTNNTGIAYEAFKRDIKWIAGPFLNMTNSFSLLCLKDKFNCSGAFLSNELSRFQIKSIIRPEGFKLYYSIYHPLILLSSRQCLFHQVTGCDKNRIDSDCLYRCSKSSIITNLKKQSFHIKKSQGNYHSIYNSSNFLNTDIIKDIPGIFSGFSIDLRNIETDTTINADKLQIITLFENLLNGTPDSSEKIRQRIHPTTNCQYKKGI